MAQPNLTTPEIQPSQPTKSELFVKIKDINDDVEGRLANEEGRAKALAIITKTVIISSSLSTTPSVELFLTEEMPAAVTITGAKLTLMENQIGSYVDNATVNGLEVDVEKASGSVLDANFTGNSIFTIKPFIDFETGANPAADDNDTGTFDLGTLNLSAGDRLRLVLTGMPAIGQQIRFKFELIL